MTEKSGRELSIEAGASKQREHTRIPTKFELAQGANGGSNQAPGVLSKFARWMTWSKGAAATGEVVINGSETLSNPKLPDEVCVTRGYLAFQTKSSKQLARRFRAPSSNAGAAFQDHARVAAVLPPGSISSTPWPGVLREMANSSRFGGPHQGDGATARWIVDCRRNVRLGSGFCEAYGQGYGQGSRLEGQCCA